MEGSSAPGSSWPGLGGSDDSGMRVIGGFVVDEVVSVGVDSVSCELRAAVGLEE